VLLNKTIICFVRWHSRLVMTWKTICWEI